MNLFSYFILSVSKRTILSILAGLGCHPTATKLCFLFYLVIFGQKSSVVLKCIWITCIWFESIWRQMWTSWKEWLCLWIASIVTWKVELIKTHTYVVVVDWLHTLTRGTAQWLRVGKVVYASVCHRCWWLRNIWCWATFFFIEKWVNRFLERWWHFEFLLIFFCIVNGKEPASGWSWNLIVQGFFFPSMLILIIELLCVVFYMRSWGLL